MTIRYIWEGTGAVLEIENYYPDEATIRYKTRYLDKELEDGHRYVFRPAVRYVDIAVTSSEQTVDINCTVALDYYQGILHILSVDAEHTTVESEKTILVIGGAPSGNTGATGGSS